MSDAYKSYVSVVARILLAAMFILSGFAKLMDLQGTAGYVASGGLPFPTLLAAGVGVFELLGGLALVIGFQARLVGLFMGVFTIAASLVFHAYWAVPADQQFVTQLLFMKNLSVAGGLLLISALGAGAFSVDAVRQDSKDR